eukprot:3633016-Rhodomonas_salina.8
MPLCPVQDVVSSQPRMHHGTVMRRGERVTSFCWSSQVMRTARRHAGIPCRILPRHSAQLFHVGNSCTKILPGIGRAGGVRVLKSYASS